MVGALSTAADPRIHDREIRFIFGESLRKFMVVWLFATVSPAVFHAVLMAALWAAIAPLKIDIDLTSGNSTGLYLGILVLGYLIGLCGAAVGAQWWVLRRRLPRAGRWAKMTAIGALAGAIVSDLPFGLAINGSPVLVDSTGAVHGILFGFVLGVVQSRALAEPLGTHHRFQWVVASGFAAGLSSIGFFLWHEMLLASIARGYLFEILDTVGIPLAAALYFLATGIVMHRLLARIQHTQTGYLAAQFD